MAIGATWPVIKEKGINLVIPIGLEKSAHTDIYVVSQRLARGVTYRKGPLRMRPLTGIIITEIEALKILAGIDAMQISAGGIGEAEGSVRLLLERDESQMERALNIIDRIQGEPPFLPRRWRYSSV